MPVRSVVLAFCVLLCACTSTTSGEGNASQVRVDGSGSIPSPPVSPCDALCDRELACGTQTDAVECVRVCEEENQLSKLRSEVRASTAACLAVRSCTSVTRGDALGECLEQAVDAPLAPSAEAQAFCDDLESADATCDLWGAAEGPVSCLDIAKRFMDATIAVARRCFSRPCSAIVTCVNDAFETVPP